MEFFKISFILPMRLYADIEASLFQYWVCHKHLLISAHYPSNHRCHMKKWQYRQHHTEGEPSLMHAVNEL